MTKCPWIAFAIACWLLVGSGTVDGRDGQPKKSAEKKIDTDPPLIEPNIGKPLTLKDFEKWDAEQREKINRDAFDPNPMEVPVHPEDWAKEKATQNRKREQAQRDAELDKRFAELRQKERELEILTIVMIVGVVFFVCLIGGLIFSSYRNRGRDKP